MHIPDAMMQGPICPITAIISFLSICTAIRASIKQERTIEPSRFAAVAALIFAMQMMNFPILRGISGHCIGAVFAARLLGLPLGILSMSLVIILQCLLLGDGGIWVLGANLLNLAILGTVAGHQVYLFLDSYLSQQKAAPFIAAWSSVVVGAFSASIELSSVGWHNIVIPMLSIHALIGVGEALITYAILYCMQPEFRQKDKKALKNLGYFPDKPIIQVPARYRSFVIYSKRSLIPLMMAALIALFATYFASSNPDGLEWAAQKAWF
jgi:cobalt/nickel transport system permease protein